MELLGDLAHVESRFSTLEIVLVLEQDMCTVCAKRSMGSKNVLHAPDGSPVL
jgi:hypothetical protein